MAAILAVAACFAVGFGFGWERLSRRNEQAASVEPLKPIPRTSESLAVRLADSDREPLSENGAEVLRIREQTRGQLFEAMRATTRLISAAEPEDMWGLFEQVRRQFRDEIVGEMLLSSVVEKWSRVDPMGLLRMRLSGRSERVFHEQDKVFEAAIKADAAEAFRILRESRADEDAEQGFLATLAEMDPERSVAYHAELGSGTFSESFAQALGTHDPDRALAMERSRPEPKMIRAAFAALAERDREAAITRALALEDPKEKDAALVAIGNPWYHSNSEKFLEFVEALPFRAQQSRVLGTVLKENLHSDNVDEILGLSARIPFERTRQAFVGKTLLQWMEWDPSDAKAWMEKNPGSEAAYAEATARTEIVNGASIIDGDF